MPSLPRTRRRRARWLVLLAAVSALAALSAPAAFARPSPTDAVRLGDVVPAAATIVFPPPESHSALVSRLPAPVPGRNVLARFEGVELVEPSPAILAIGFHQAGGNHPGLEPVGRLIANDNPAGSGPVEGAAAPAIRIMSSRGRGGPGTSAVDVALDPAATVHSPVTGTVAAVNHYALYGEVDDVLIEIEPAGRPDLRVMLFHLVDPEVAVGDAVTAGSTPIAGHARVLPVRNQIDRFASAHPSPHVDVRIRRI